METWPILLVFVNPAMRPRLQLEQLPRTWMDLFDVLKNMSDEAQVFKKLEQQLDLKTTVPFIEILPGPKRP